MARPLRVDVEDGWYHVMSRGIERRVIFLDDSFCLHFLDLLGEMSSRFGVEVHAYVLLGNHYHLIIRTPHANASQAMQWLNVSFSAWSNAKRKRVGHVFQGRFRSTLIEGDGGWLLKASAYLHLNPVRVSKLGLDKVSNRAKSRGLVKSVSPEHSNRSFVANRIPFDRIVSVVESVKGESFADFRDRHGDWGVAMVFYLARLHSGVTLQQIGDQVGNLAYKTVFARIKYLKKKIDKDASLQQIYEQCKKHLSIIEMPPCPFNHATTKI